jgi:hypothetical protein
MFHTSEFNGGPEQTSTDFPFMTLADAIADAPPEPDWNWPGYVAPGAGTLIAARPKVGKTTLVFGMVAAMLHGRQFCGRKASCKGVLLLSEEGIDTLAEKARRFGIDHPRFHVLLRRRVQAPWFEVVLAAREYCREHDLDVLIIDTFDKWTGIKGDDENKSGRQLEAFEPVALALGDGLAVVVVAHQRKTAGEHGEAVRGSNALVGAVDIVLEIERVAGVPRARALIGTSRFTGTPEEVAVELTDGGYVNHGEVDGLKDRLDRGRILSALNNTDWKTSQEIAEAIDMPGPTVRDCLNKMHEMDEVERDGEGKRGSPYRWRILSGPPKSDGAERNETDPDASEKVGPSFSPEEEEEGLTQEGEKPSAVSFCEAEIGVPERKNGGPLDGRTIADLSDEEIMEIFAGAVTIEKGP